MYVYTYYIPHSHWGSPSVNSVYTLVVASWCAVCLGLASQGVLLCILCLCPQNLVGFVSRSRSVMTLHDWRLGFWGDGVGGLLTSHTLLMPRGQLSLGTSNTLCYAVMAPHDCFKPDMQYWVYNPWAKKDLQYIRWFGRDSGMILSIHSQSLFAQYFSTWILDILGLKMVMMDLTGHTCDLSHDIQFEDDSKTCSRLHSLHFTSSGDGEPQVLCVLVYIYIL